MADFDGLLQPLQPYAEYLLSVGRQYDPTLVVTSVRRTASQQTRLYQRYLAGQSLYPAAPPGQSLHELGRAFDIYTENTAVLNWLGSVWQSWGGRWGGAFGNPDPIHFEA